MGAPEITIIYYYYYYTEQQGKHNQAPVAENPLRVASYDLTRKLRRSLNGADLVSGDTNRGPYVSAADISLNRVCLLSTV